jgi:hypothetical protein
MRGSHIDTFQRLRVEEDETSNQKLNGLGYETGIPMEVFHTVR